jgi:hypothetical protein
MLYQCAETSAPVLCRSYFVPYDTNPDIDKLTPLMEIDMARQEVTFDEVMAAAISLQDDGKRATIDAVRDFFGAGSPNTIHKHLIAWRANQELSFAALLNAM